RFLMFGFVAPAGFRPKRLHCFDMREKGTEGFKYSGASCTSLLEARIYPRIIYVRGKNNSTRQLPSDRVIALHGDVGQIGHADKLDTRTNLTPDKFDKRTKLDTPDTWTGVKFVRVSNLSVCQICPGCPLPLGFSHV